MIIFGIFRLLAKDFQSSKNELEWVSYGTISNYFQVILTVRDNQHVWFESYRNFLENWHIEGIPRVNITLNTWFLIQSILIELTFFKLKPHNIMLIIYTMHDTFFQKNSEPLRIGSEH